MTDLFGAKAEPRLGVSGHESSRMERDEWLTPPHIFKALGAFDLDPCAPRERPWDTATRHYTIMDNGLARAWEGRVWLNPPYGRELGKWMSRMAQHGLGVALTFARTETKVFQQHVFPAARAMLFLAGRVHFHFSDGRRGGGVRCTVCADCLQRR